MTARGANLAFEFPQYPWWEAKDIPPHDWLLDHYLLRGVVTMVAAAGAGGKSSLVAAMALSLVTGRPMLRKPVYCGPQCVALWNLEDDQEQPARQLTATAIAHGVKPEDCSDRLFVASGLGGMGLPPLPLVTASQDDGSFRLRECQFERIEAALATQKIDLLIIDPFVSSHHAREYDTEAMDRLVKRWALVAKRCNCALVIVHHTRKTNGEKADIDAVRGSIAGVNAARIVLLLNRMTEADGQAFGLEDDERRRVFSIDLGKANRSPPEAVEWYRMESISIGNGIEGGHADDVGAVLPWSPPSIVDEFSVAQLEMARTAIANGAGRGSAASPAWVGHLIGNALQIDSKTDQGKARLKLLLRTWMTDGKLRRVKRSDPDQRKEFDFVELGTSPWFEETDQWVARKPFKVAH